MTTKVNPITQAEIESYLWGAATLLRGYIDAGDYKQFIFPLLFWKRLCDVYNEERALAVDELGDDFPEYHRFSLPWGAHWEDVRAYTVNVGIEIQKAMRAIEERNPSLDGIFGDAPWTNKERLSDETLIDLIEHFSTQTLSRARVNEDLLGQAYEYLIKKFADDSGHTAAEFYTNRTVVHLMTALLEPQEGESVYDPTCGSGGMLLSAAEELKRRGQDTRTLKMYGQEVNLMTSAIARMNLFMHGFEDFQIIRGDTLANPYFREGNRLQQFDVILANPPYSVNSWNRAAFERDPYGRNLFGTPPQGRADYAFWQHIIASLKPDTGRCAILFPHGVLFRNEERHMREPMVKADVIEAVIGLGPNLFYNSPMEACVVVCRMNKPADRRGKLLLINAVNEVTRERAFSYLTDTHLDRIASTYHAFEDVDGFARVVTIDEVLHDDANLSIPLHVRLQNGKGNDAERPLHEVIAVWQMSSDRLHHSMNELFVSLAPVVPPPTPILPSEYVIGEMGRIATQVDELMRLYQSPSQQLAASLSKLTNMQDLLFVKPPMQNLVEAMNAVLPKIDMSFFTGLSSSAVVEMMNSVPPIDHLALSGLNNSILPDSIIGQLGMNASDALMASMPRIDFASLVPLNSPALSMQSIFGEIGRTANLLASDAFANIQASLGLSPNFERTIESLLSSLTTSGGEQLRELLGETEDVEVTIGALSGTLPFDELPSAIRSNVSKARDLVYRHGIAVTVLLIWVINLLWLFRDKDFEPASALGETLLALLILLKEMKNKE